MSVTERDWQRHRHGWGVLDRRQLQISKKDNIKRMCHNFAGSLGRQRWSTSLVVADLLDSKVKTENGAGLTNLENGWFSNRFEAPLEKGGSKISTYIV